MRVWLINAYSRPVWDSFEVKIRVNGKCLQLYPARNAITWNLRHVNQCIGDLISGIGQNFEVTKH